MSQLPTSASQSDIYQELDPAMCPAEHPAAIVAARSCLNCFTSRRRFVVWPSYCHVCHTDRLYGARKRMDQDGLICLVCLPMCADRIGQARVQPQRA